MESNTRTLFIVAAVSEASVKLASAFYSYGWDMAGALVGLIDQSDSRKADCCCKW